MAKRVLTSTDRKEIIDLYRWGARMTDMEMLYGTCRQNIRHMLKKNRVPMRPTHRTPLANPKPHNLTAKVTSIRPLIPVGALIVEDRPTPDQLLHSSAHAQQDRRTAEHQSGANTRSYPEAASECRYAFLRSGNHLPDLE